ncbi:MAG TPA: D-alanine--D-alanine ligase [Solimonas sp.]|nr:D-alanine--D-alanine ligase [Solimonas sp.]
MTGQTRDAQAFGKVAVLYGGWSAEREVSLWSGQNVHEALRRRGVQADLVDVKDPAQLFALRQQGYVRAFNIMHGTGGEDGTVQAVLDLLGIAYPGSGVLASALAMDKLRTKRIWKAEGLPTPEFLILASVADAERAAERLGYPFIIKPAADGSSVGVTKVKNPEQIAKAYADALGPGRVVMAERFVAGGEYTCAMLAGEPLPLVRIVPDGEFYDYHAKYISEKTQYLCPAGVEAAHEQRLQQLCAQAFELIGARDWGRVDFLMGDDGQPWLLEINTLPGMTSHSLVPMAARARGVDFDTLCWRLLETTLEAGG